MFPTPAHSAFGSNPRGRFGAPLREPRRPRARTHASERLCANRVPPRRAHSQTGRAPSSRFSALSFVDFAVAVGAFLALFGLEASLDATPLVFGARELRALFPA